jgi:hypothetical protein
MAGRVAPWAVGAVAIAAVVVARIADAALDAARESGEPPPEALRWATIGLSVLWQISFGIACLLHAAPAPAAAGTEGERLSGCDAAASGLRQLAAAMIVRMALGVLASIGTGLALREGGGGLPLLSAFLDAAIAIWVAASLVRYRRLPPDARGEGSGLALAAVIVSVPLGLVSGWVASRLGGLVAQARDASSLWGMPSLSEIENLQTALAFTTVTGMLAGVAGGIGLATSFVRTAERLGRDDLTRTARRLLGLIVAASLLVAVIVVPVLAGAALPSELLLALAVVALALGIFAAVSWVQVTLGLSRALSS